MNRIEKLAAHSLFYLIFTALFLNLGLIAGISVSRWSLPVTYLSYVGGVAAWRWRKKLRPQRWQLGLVILLPLAFFLIAKGFGYAYDTSWDGQDYQQSGVIELANGWNPWHDGDHLPLKLPGGEMYVQGYPKTTWLIQSSIYKLTGHLQMASVTTVVVAAISGVFVYGVVRRLGLSAFWRWFIALAAVLEIHAVQQMPTLMADGYSYQLALIAICTLLIMMLDRAKQWPLWAFLSAWLLLTGSKFSNLLVCAVVGAVALVYAWRTGLLTKKWLWASVVGFVLAAVVLLWVPYGSNTLRHGSPVWPQNLASESAKLRFDNVPNNLKHANHFELLFYGIFSRTLRPDGGNALSPHNVGELKIPFTFHDYEIGQINNFQGRVGSAGVFFSGIIVLAAALFGLIVWRRQDLRKPHLLVAASILMALVIASALAIPVPNKLRYSPLITLLPLVVLALLASLRRQKTWWVRSGQVALTAFIAANFLIGAFALVDARVHEARLINRQLKRMQATHSTYEVSAVSFYGSYTRLQEHGIPIKITKHSELSCKNPIPLMYTYNTTTFCRITKR